MNKTMTVGGQKSEGPQNENQDNLLLELERLRKENAQLKADLDKIALLIFRGLSAIGLWPWPKNVQAQILKTAKDVVFDLTMRKGNKYKDKFSFIRELQPMFEKLIKRKEAEGITMDEFLNQNS